MHPLRLLAFLQGVRPHLLLWHLLEFQTNFIVSGRLVDIGPQTDYSLKDMQLLLLEQQLPFLYLVLRRLVIRKEVLFVDRCEV